MLLQLANDVESRHAFSIMETNSDYRLYEILQEPDVILLTQIADGVYMVFRK